MTTIDDNFTGLIIGQSLFQSLLKLTILAQKIKLHTYVHVKITAGYIQGMRI